MLKMRVWVQPKALSFLKHVLLKIIGCTIIIFRRKFLRRLIIDIR